MDINILKDYIDACELEKELEKRIQALEQQSMTHDVVSGSNPDFPYQGQHFHIEGVTQQTDTNYEYEQLKQQRDRIKQLRQQVDEIIAKAPARIQRIIRYKYFDKLSWIQIAKKFSSTPDSIRMELKRYMKNI